jgi:hypothetical protein
LLSSADVKLSAERGVTGLEKERCGSVPLALLLLLPLLVPLPLTWPDSGYGLFFAACFFDLAVALLCFFVEELGESEEDLRFASRFMKPAKGRLRTWRSLVKYVSPMLVYGLQIRHTT